MNFLKKRLICFLEKLIQKNFILFIVLYRKYKVVFAQKSFKTQNQISVINTHDIGGGSAKIAFTLSNNIKNHLPVNFYVRDKKSNEIWVDEIVQKKYTFLEEVLRREAIKKGWLEFTGFHALSLLDDDYFNKSKIVHLHNLHGEFFSPILFKSLFKDKKIIWTLHDESFMTGHCSCTLGCNRWKTGCGSCPDLSIFPSVNFDNTKKVLSFKKKLIVELQPIVVCPSNWLAERVKIAYPELKNVNVIKNGVDLNIFYPKDKIEFATQNPFKGGQIIRKIIADSAFLDKVFISVGGSNNTEFPNHISYPYVSNEVDLANLYAACDVLLYPTQADNLPLVVLESMACGTPVITSKLGGIPEIIENEIDGILVEDYTSAFQFKNSLQTFFSFTPAKQNLISSNSRIKVSKKFSLHNMNLEYSNLYKLILRF